MLDSYFSLVWNEFDAKTINNSAIKYFSDSSDKHYCKNFIAKSHYTNIHFTMEKETDHVLPFLDVLIDNTHHGSVVTSAFRNKTFTGLLSNYLSFAPLSYKIGLIRTLIDRVFKINNTWLAFHKGHYETSFHFAQESFPRSSHR